MEDLIEGFAKTVELPSQNNTDFRKHSYKKKSCKSDNQDVRRLERLKSLKDNKFNFLMTLRSIPDCKDIYSDEEDNKMDVKVSYPLKIMMSEWFVDVPKDFKDEWVMKVCPKGRRSLVIFNGNTTRVFSKTGVHISTFYARKNLVKKAFSAFDCIYNSNEGVYYVLDCMSWNGTDMYMHDTEFRFYWKARQFEEQPSLSVKSRENPYPLKNLSFCSCNKKDIESEIRKWNPEKIDGLLFYHKKTSYTVGTTPLVMWMKLDQLDEKLKDIV